MTAQAYSLSTPETRQEAQEFEVSLACRAKPHLDRERGINTLFSILPSCFFFLFCMKSLNSTHTQDVHLKRRSQRLLVTWASNALPELTGHSSKQSPAQHCRHVQADPDPVALTPTPPQPQPHAARRMAPEAESDSVNDLLLAPSGRLPAGEGQKLFGLPTRPRCATHSAPSRCRRPHPPALGSLFLLLPCLQPGSHPGFPTETHSPCSTLRAAPESSPQPGLP